MIVTCSSRAGASRNMVVVPPQTIEDGHVRLQVIEGFIDRINVEGDVTGLEQIRAYAQRVRSDGPLSVRDLERALLLINDMPGVRARSVLSPSQAQPGAADLNIIVERHAYDAEIFTNNFGTRYLGPWQLGGSGALNGMFGNNERLTGQIVVAPDWDFDLELFYAALGYQMPVNDLGTTVQLQGTHTRTEPGYTLEQFDVEGRAHSLAATVAHPFVRSRRFNASGRITFDMRNVDSSNNLEPTRKDRIRAVRMGGRVDNIDRFFGAGYNMVDLQISQGLGILGATSENDELVSRPGADSRFLKAEIEMQRLQRIGGGVNLLMAGRGQWANENLLSSEEFGVGGMGYGRGYDPSEIIGDDGIAGKLELQWNDPHPLDMVNTYQLYGFYDAGRVWSRDATAADLQRQTLTSAGVGVRGTVFDATSMDLILAVPLNRDVQTRGNRHPRLFFGVNHRF